MLTSAVALSGAPEGSQAYAIRYRSTDFSGRPNELTGLLIEPAEAVQSAMERPIVVWTHGTTGISERCAPSTAPLRFEQIAGLEDMLRRGWVVVAPDYAGLGSPGPHPYLVAEATARAVLDSARAAREHPSAHAGRRFAIWGLSQGGHAALVSGERAKSQVPDLELVGVAAAAPPTELRANFGHGTKPIARGVLMAFVAGSWTQVYGASLDTLHLPGNGRVLVRLSRICALGQGAKLTTMIGAVAAGRAVQRVDVPNIEPWGKLLAQNSAKPWQPTLPPLLIAQSPKDEIVAPQVTLAYAHASCRTGAQLRWIAPAEADHAGTAALTASTTVQWLADRFDSVAPTNDCSNLR